MYCRKVLILGVIVIFLAAFAKPQVATCSGTQNTPPELPMDDPGFDKTLSEPILQRDEQAQHAVTRVDDECCSLPSCGERLVAKLRQEVELLRRQHLHLVVKVALYETLLQSGE